MTSIGSPSPFFLAGKKAYEVERSFRFDSASSTYLQRQPSSSTSGSTQKITISFWIKLGNIPSGTNGGTFFGTAGDSHRGQFFNQELYFQYGSNNWINTTGVFRDPSAWYHIVYAVDTTQSTTSNRQKIYVNGVLQGRGDTISDPSQNAYIDFFNNSSETYYIGRRQSGNYFDGYLAEINFIDGLAYDPSSFGEADSITGQWNPKKYVGSYGTNGFYLDFSDNSSITNMCLDKSGNGNNFSPDNCNTEDSMLDTPTNNFSTWNPISSNAITTLLEGNLKNNGDNNKACNATFGVTSGKWYWEIYALTDISSTNYIVASGVTGYEMVNDGDVTPRLNYDTSKYSYYKVTSSGGYTQYKRYTDASLTEVSSGGTFMGGAVLSFRLDMDAGTLKFYTNNTLVHTDSTIPTDGTVIFPMQNATNSGVSRHNASIVNFGQDGTFAGNKTAQGNTDEGGIGNFFYAVPSGHKALCSANLSDPTIKLPNKHFEARTYTGTATGSGTQTLTGFQFQPDWVWIKSRAIGYSHLLVDAVRGASKGLLSEDTNAEETTNVYGMLTAFTSDGYTMTRGSNDGGKCCEDTQTYVSWNWNAGNTDGKTYVVKVHDFSGNNRYIFDDFQTEAVTLDLAEGGTYIFNMDDSSNASHPFSIGTAANGTVYTSGITYFLDGVSKTYSEYTLGFSAATTRRLHITVPASAPVLYYWCSVHSGMGGQINTNSTLGSSNFDGTLQSTVKVNATAGFSIVSYTVGNSSGMTMGHGLGVSPVIAISKKRSGTSDWSVQFVNPSDNSTDYMFLNKTDAKGDTSTYFTSTTVKDGFGTGANGDTIIQYVFSEVAGYSKLGSYTGNGSSNGTFVFTGFRPAWVMVKRIDTTNDWPICDNKRNPSNLVDKALYADLSIAESTVNRYDFLSNGFKIRNNLNESNASGGTYIYLAFAESPFKNARAR